MLSSLEHRCAGSSDCGGVLEYIEPMCIEAHLEAHVYVRYIPTHLGLEEYNNYYPPIVLSVKQKTWSKLEKDKTKMAYILNKGSMT